MVRSCYSAPRGPSYSTIPSLHLTDSYSECVLLVKGDCYQVAHRILMKAINLVDFWPTFGNFNGVVVDSNTINSQVRSLFAFSSFVAE